MLHNITFRQKMLVMVAVLSGMFLAALDQSIIGTALPKIVADFNGLNELSWVVTAYLLTSTITVPISGTLSDIFGRRRLLIVAILVFVGGSMLTGLSWNMGSLIAFRAIQGVGGGMLFASAFSVIGDLFSPAERAKWQGVFGAVFGLSSLIGPLLGGFLTDNFSWRWCFYINVPVGIVALSLILRFLPTIIAKNAEKRIDYGGAGLLSVGLASLLLGFTWGGTEFPWGSWQVIGLFALSVIVLSWFVAYERRQHDPIIPMDIFKNGIFRVSVSILFLIGMAMFGAIVYIPLYAQTVQGASATNSGIILLPMVIALTVTSLIGGQIISRLGKYKVMAVAGAFIITGSLFWFSTLSASSSHLDLILRMIPLGVGVGIAMPLFNLVVQNAFPQNRLGVVSSSTQLFRGIGSTVGVAVMGTYLNHQIASKLSGLAESDFARSMAQAGHGLGTLDANTLQHVLSKDGQMAIEASIRNLPAAAQPGTTKAFHEFVAQAQIGMSQSITRVFFLAGVVLIASCVLVFFLKEVPLRKSNDHTPAAH